MRDYEELQPGDRVKILGKHVGMTLKAAGLIKGQCITVTVK